MKKCVLCNTFYPVRDLDMTHTNGDELNDIYICKLGMGCLEDEKIETRNISAPYSSLKVFKKETPQDGGGA